MRVRRLIRSLDKRRDTPCLIEDGETFSFRQIGVAQRRWRAVLAARRVDCGMVVALQTEHGVEAVALLLALVARGCTVALVPPGEDPERYCAAARVEVLVRLTAQGRLELHAAEPEGDEHPLVAGLHRRGEAGLIIFTSGSTGEPKAALHSFEKFLGKFDRQGKRLRTLALLMFDHIAGMDTLFYALCAGGSLVIPTSRDPGTIGRLIEAHGVEVLPASPTFLNLLCLAGIPERSDLSSLKIITYGSEPMIPAVLERLNELFPHVRIIQKYGTSEFGSPRALSRGGDSLWLKPSAEEMETVIRDGVLWVRAPAAMLGYLNADSPFDDEGFLCTGDLVEQDGDWIRIRGRASEIINVGGEKVSPPEVEAVLMELDLVADASVRGEAHPMVGQMVTARINLREPASEEVARRVVRKHCRARLAAHKRPAKVEFTRESLSTARHKKVRV
jgi:acyl-CoA synthetase (AMP-forming)/AMP-acid ligase II